MTNSEDRKKYAELKIKIAELNKEVSLLTGNGERPYQDLIKEDILKRVEVIFGIKDGACRHSIKSSNGSNGRFFYDLDYLLDGLRREIKAVDTYFAGMTFNVIMKDEYEYLVGEIEAGKFDEGFKNSVIRDGKKVGNTVLRSRLLRAGIDVFNIRSDNNG